MSETNRPASDQGTAFVPPSGTLFLHPRRMSPVIRNDKQAEPEEEVED